MQRVMPRTTSKRWESSLVFRLPWSERCINGVGLIRLHSTIIKASMNNWAVMYSLSQQRSTLSCTASVLSHRGKCVARLQRLPDRLALRA